jgi:hypothetical protein
MIKNCPHLDCKTSYFKGRLLNPRDLPANNLLAKERNIQIKKLKKLIE